jgi:hypothetical protein
MNVTPAYVNSMYAMSSPYALINEEIHNGERKWSRVNIEEAMHNPNFKVGYLTANFINTGRLSLLNFYTMNTRR